MVSTVLEDIKENTRALDPCSVSISFFEELQDASFFMQLLFFLIWTSLVDWVRHK
jgi:hypothetical protein